MKISDLTYITQERKRLRAHLALIRSCVCLMAIAFLPGNAFAQSQLSVTFGPGESAKTVQLSRGQTWPAGADVFVNVTTTPTQVCGFVPPHDALASIVSMPSSLAEQTIQDITAAATSDDASLPRQMSAMSSLIGLGRFIVRGSYQTRLTQQNAATMRQGAPVTQSVADACLDTASARTWFLELARILKLYYGIPQ